MRHAKVDRDHAALLTVARQLGWSAASTAAVGAGFPDAVLAHRAGALLLVEFKTGKRGRLTPAQTLFWASWRGPIAMVRSEQELITLLTSPPPPGTPDTHPR